ncbi:17352_t:CDS:2 [Funneliformis geosporum]|nr:17352_t:CDS:2 [Funneliformis geosporum]
MANPNGLGKLMICTLNASNASIHGIIEQEKIHIKAYDWTEGSIKELLISSAKYISLTTDLWTSHAKQEYIGITASFIDSDFKIYEILLELKYLPYLHIKAISYLDNNIPSDISLKAAFLDSRFKDLNFARYEKEQIIQLIQNELKNNSTNDNIIPLNEEDNIQNIESKHHYRKAKNVLFSQIFSNVLEENIVENELNQYINSKSADPNIDLCK